MKIIFALNSDSFVLRYIIHLAHVLIILKYYSLIKHILMTAESIIAERGTKLKSLIANLCK